VRNIRDRCSAKKTTQNTDMRRLMNSFRRPRRFIDRPRAALSFLSGRATLVGNPVRYGRRAFDAASADDARLLRALRQCLLYFLSSRKCPDGSPVWVTSGSQRAGNMPAGFSPKAGARRRRRTPSETCLFPPFLSCSFSTRAVPAAECHSKHCVVSTVSTTTRFIAHRRRLAGSARCRSGSDKACDYREDLAW